MMPFVTIFIFQLLIAGIVIVVLKRVLDRELEQVAMEKLRSLKTNPDIKKINIYYVRPFSLHREQEFKGVIKNKFVNSEVIFEQLKELKGGLIIKVADEILDFSLSSRLESFWS